MIIKSIISVLDILMVLSELIISLKLHKFLCLKITKVLPSFLCELMISPQFLVVYLCRYLIHILLAHGCLSHLCLLLFVHLHIMF